VERRESAFFGVCVGRFSTSWDPGIRIESPTSTTALTLGEQLPYRYNNDWDSALFRRSCRDTVVPRKSLPHWTVVDSWALVAPVLR
jgi:hypothetical protein